MGFDKFMNLLLKDVEEDYTVMVQAGLQCLHCVSAESASDTLVKAVMALVASAKGLTYGC